MGRPMGHPMAGPIAQSIAWAAGLGLACGLGWGIGARGWMRLISNDPEFSWAGTLMIIGFSAWLGLGVGLVYGTRGLGRLRWIRLLGLPAIILFAGPGAAFVPAFLLAGPMWNKARRPLLRGFDITIGALALTIPAGMLAMATAHEPGLPPTTYEMFEFVTGFALLSLLLSYGGSFLWRPAPLVASLPTTADPARSHAIMR